MPMGSQELSLMIHSPIHLDSMCMISKPFKDYVAVIKAKARGVSQIPCNRRKTYRLCWLFIEHLPGRTGEKWLNNERMGRLTE